MVGQINGVSSYPQPGFWPGRVDFYCDHCTANVWNTYRVARLLLLDLLVRLTPTTNGTRDNEWEDEIHLLLSEILASIPYHLVENMHLFIQEAARGATSIEARGRGRLVGGLLLMKVLHITLQLESVVSQVRCYLQDCLQWIAENMGIGQASVYSKVTDVPPQPFGSDKMILWAGFLI